MSSFVSRHRFLSASAAALAILAGGILWLVFHDTTPPDDRDLLLPVPPPIAQKDNAATILSKLNDHILIDRHDFPEFHQQIPQNEWIDTLYAPEKGAALRKAILQKNERAISAFKAAIAKPCAQYGPESPTDPAYDPEITRPSRPLQFVHEAYCLRWYDMPDDFIEDATDTIAFLQRYATSPGATFNDFSDGMMMERISIQHIITCTGYMKDSAVCRGAIARLDQARISREAMADAIKKAYLRSIEQMEIPGYFGTTFLPDAYRHKKNITRRLMVDITREALESIKKSPLNLQGKSIQAALESYESAFSSDFLVTYMPNSIGTSEVVSLAFDLYMWHDAHVTLNNEISFAQCTLALRAYWLDHATLPDSLDALVPKYLPAVPLGYCSKKPLQFDKTKAMIYAASEAPNYLGYAAPQDPEDGPCSILNWIKTDP